MVPDTDSQHAAGRTDLAHRVAAGDGERLAFDGMEFLIRASAKSTGGAFSIIEEINPIDVPPHIHRDFDELFYVLEGGHVFTVGDDSFEAGPGDIVFGPRGVPHAQRRKVPRQGRILTMFAPAGFEGFFRDLVDAYRPDRAGSVDLGMLAQKYGVVWV